MTDDQMAHAPAESHAQRPEAAAEGTEQGEAVEATVGAPTCSAHGRTVAEHTGAYGYDCTMPSPDCQCGMFDAIGMHWDTCPGRGRRRDTRDRMTFGSDLVPAEAEFERKWETQRGWLVEAQKAHRDAVAERDGLRRKLDAVRALHTSPNLRQTWGTCDGCGFQVPCPTIQALDGE